MYILFDVGGTLTRLATSRDGKTFGVPTEFKTAAVFEEQVRLFSEAVAALGAGTPVRACAGGIKGSLGADGTLHNSPGLPDWSGKNFKQRIEEVTGAPVFVDNDTAVVGLGEAVAGAGKNYPIAAYVTVSTGANGIRIVDGKRDRGSMGFEIGHHILNAADQVRCSCSADLVAGHAEAYITGSAFERRFGKKAYEITDATVWEEAARYLAIMLHNVIVFWSPDVIVVGGSMITGTAGPVIPLKATREEVARLRTMFPRVPVIVEAALGSFGGIHGALAMLGANIDA